MFACSMVTRRFACVLDFTHLTTLVWSSLNGQAFKLVFLDSELQVVYSTRRIATELFQFTDTVEMCPQDTFYTQTFYQLERR